MSALSPNHPFFTSFLQTLFLSDAFKTTSMNGLKRVSANFSETRTNCPICDGSFGACKLRLQ
jgi:hypothetical protein